MNSTTEARVGWVSDPNGRGTAGLLWGCFATLYLSTWSMMHPNLPGRNDSPYKIFGRKMLYMTLAVVAPEIVTVSAFDDMRRIWRRKKEHKLVNPRTKTPWSLKQHFFLDMGGFVLRPDPSKPDIIVPTRNKLIELFESGELDVPDFDDSDIEDRNKANWFTKSLTIIQTGYFIVQLIGRWEQSLPTTTLELFTLSIVFFAVLTYTAWWTKPFDIQKPIVLPLRPHYDDRVGAIESIKRAQLLDGGSDGTQDNLKDWIGLICVTPTFAAIHLIGWNFSFPTQREQMIWRVGSILSGAVPFVWATIGAYFVHTKSDKRHEFRSNLIHLSFMVVYLAIRIVLGVEMLVNLRSVPAGVYETPEWTEYFPWFS